MNQIIGLPVIVSTRYRIVIDKNLREFHGIPLTGSVLLLMSNECLQVFPSTTLIEGAVIKEISIGRFNLPIEWARSNGINVGDRVFLIAADDRILVCPSVKRIQPTNDERKLK